MKKIRYILFLILLVSCTERVQRPIEIEIAEIELPLKLVISGDYMQHSPQITAAKIAEGFDYKTSLQYIAPLWQSADFALINLETTLSKEPPYSGYPMFRSPIEVIEALKHSGITHIALANNHCMDRGRNGVEQTIQELERQGIEYMGVALDSAKFTQPLIIEKYNKKVALINYTYGTNGMPVPKGILANSELDTLQMLGELERIKQDSVDYIVAFVHWGDEYATAPNRAQKKLALFLRKIGVDVVVGSHPHVAQPIDTLNSVVYSLGNFVSNQRQPLTDAGYSVSLLFHSMLAKPKISYEPHYVDISEPGIEKYRVLRLKDSLIIEDLSQRKRMQQAIQKVHDIVGEEVKY